ncbi:DEAD/DEAH box helicase [Zhongshania sp. BJYM1]|uniref:DEAD/DEAH box helicase n=1 Tax=Zhongshania aquatica TaxID=2965069 RepID=UPI0022B59752|nr:DEAD/DEAH box helicase family protein [Marortus sp. BJYM1]
MKFTLKEYQSEAVRDALDNLRKARKRWHEDTDRYAFSLTAATGAGKTVMAAAAFEAMFYGDDDFEFDADPSAVVIWFSDDPSLNEQTRFRLMEASDRIQHTDMVVVENTFNRAKFEAKKIYFLNTQKLGKKSLLVRGHEPEEGEAGMFPETRPDMRAFTIWDTIRNTIEDPELTLYLVLDEAHRGMGNPNAAAQNTRTTIVQNLINGKAGVPGIPIVWGISATVERFNRAMEGAVKRITLPDVTVDAAKVQESGLIKDTILIDIPEDSSGDFDTVLVRRGAQKLKAITEAWAEYAKRQEDDVSVIPLMVLQVPNTPDPNDIGRALDTIYQQWPELPNGSVAHVFGEHSTQHFGNRAVPYIQPERVQDSTWVRILIAKDAISTGWDCPRAEVMVSFRPAKDRTHITQLLGRMVRSPLARRIAGDDRLNAVECLLPKFDAKTVEQVVDSLKSGDETAATTAGRILINPAEMAPNPAIPDAVWEAFEALPSQSRPQRNAKPAKRLTALAHELAADDILEGAGKKAHAVIHAALDKFQNDQKATIEAKRKAVLTVDGKTVVADMKGQTKSFDQFWENADMAVIDDSYRRAARILSPDIARTYVDFLAYKEATPDDADEFEEALMNARVSIAAMGLLGELLTAVDSEADKLAKAWLVAYRDEIKALPDDRRDTYREIQELSTDPQDVDMERPGARYEATKVRERGVENLIPTFKAHMLSDDKGEFPAILNGPESDVVSKESGRDGFVCWYRNPQQPGQSSLGIAYKAGEEYKIMRPDFLFFALGSEGEVSVDIVDPHGAFLGDALAKLRGLAVYAETHPNYYRRILSIDKVGVKLRTLDLKNDDVRAAIAGADANDPDAAKKLFAGSFGKDYE